MPSFDCPNCQDIIEKIKEEGFADELKDEIQEIIDKQEELNKKFKELFNKKNKDDSQKKLNNDDEDDEEDVQMTHTNQNTSTSSPKAINKNEAINNLKNQINNNSNEEVPANNQKQLNLGSKTQNTPIKSKDDQSAKTNKESLKASLNEKANTVEVHSQSQDQAKQKLDIPKIPKKKTDVEDLTMISDEDVQSTKSTSIKTRNQIKMMQNQN